MIVAEKIDLRTPRDVLAAGRVALKLDVLLVSEADERVCVVGGGAGRHGGYWLLKLTQAYL